MIYASQDLSRVGAAVEERIRKELGVTTPISYRVTDQTTGETTSSGALGQWLRLLWGTSIRWYGMIEFDIPSPRSAKLQARVARSIRNNSLVPSLLYSTMLATNVKAQLWLESPGLLSKSRFAGDVEAIAKLNGSDYMLSMANKFARTQAEFSRISVTLPRFLAIIPQDSGALLTAQTMPATVGFLGTNFTNNAKEFFELATEIERTLNAPLRGAPS